MKDAEKAQAVIDWGATQGEVLKTLTEALLVARWHLADNGGDVAPVDAILARVYDFLARCPACGRGSEGCIACGGAGRVE